MSRDSWNQHRCLGPRGNRCLVDPVRSVGRSKSGVLKKPGYKKIGHEDKLDVLESKNRGRGVFANRAIKKGEVIEIAPVLRIPKRDKKKIHDTFMHQYVFEDVLVLGYGSLYNHSYCPNAIYEWDEENGTFIYTAIRPINKGEEVFINYLGDPEATDRLWFEVNGRTTGSQVPVDKVKAVLEERLRKIFEQADSGRIFPVEAAEKILNLLKGSEAKVLTDSQIQEVVSRFKSGYMGLIPPQYRPAADVPVGEEAVDVVLHDFGAEENLDHIAAILDMAPSLGLATQEVIEYVLDLEIARDMKLLLAQAVSNRFGAQGKVVAEALLRRLEVDVEERLWEEDNPAIPVIEIYREEDGDHYRAFPRVVEYMRNLSRKGASGPELVTIIENLQGVDLGDVNGTRVAQALEDVLRKQLRRK